MHTCDFLDGVVRQPDIARLILILNALPYCPTLKASFPTFMGAHYAFLASSLPHLVPQLEVSSMVIPEKICMKILVTAFKLNFELADFKYFMKLINLWEKSIIFLS